MAYITIVSGGAQPVFATDVLNGTPSQQGNLAAAAVTNFQGPKLDFFQATSNAALTGAGAGNVGGFVSNTLQSIQQTSTVAMYQVNPAANTVLNVAVFPTGAFANAATFLTACQVANGAGGAYGWASSGANAVFTTQGTYYVG
jgi:hypothetical protein